MPTPPPSIRPPQWVSALALISAIAAFAWTMVTSAPPPAPDPQGFSNQVRRLFAREEWSSTVDLSRAELEENTDSLEARFFLAFALERRGFEGDAIEARQVWARLRDRAGELVREAEMGGPLQLESVKSTAFYFEGWALRSLGMEDVAQRRWAEAAEARGKIARERNRSIDHYIHSNLLALIGERDAAITAWHDAVVGGYSDWTWVNADPDLTELRRDPMFDAVALATTGRLGEVVRDLYVVGVRDGSMALLRELTERHLRHRPRDLEALLFRAYALDFDRADASVAWADLRFAAERRARREIVRHQRRVDLANAAERAEDPSEGRSTWSPPERGRWLLDEAEVGEFFDTDVDEIVVPTDPAAATDAGVSSQTLYYLGWAKRGGGDAEGAAAVFAQIAEEGRDPDRPTDPFNAACHAALAGDTDTALARFALAASGGGFDRRWAWVDPDLEPIRSDPRFIAAMGGTEGRPGAGDGATGGAVNGEVNPEG